jgi:transcription elongation factor GreA
MDHRDSLAAVLRGDLAAALAPADRERLEALAHEAQGEGRLVSVREECASRLRQGNASHAVEYLLAAACALNGEVERAVQTLLALGEKLAAAGRWEPLAAVSERSLGLEETGAAARLLVRAHEGIGRDPARLEALEHARLILPDDLDLGLLFAVRLGEAGQGERRRDLLAELIPAFAAEGQWSGLEEAALEFVEHESLEGLVELIQFLPTVVAKGSLKEAQQLLAIAFPAVAGAGRAGEVHAALRQMAAKAVEQGGEGAGEPFRDAVVESLRQGPGRELPEPEGVIEMSRVADPMKPIAVTLETFDTIAALPPGGAVHHASFGAGRIVANDAETVVMDFARSRGHKMPYAAARRTLTRIPDDDLRLLRVTAPNELVRLRVEEPGEMVARALAAMGGAAETQRLKVFLVGSDLIPAAEWNIFWRKAKVAADKHPRIDASRAFEQHYKLKAAAAADDTPLPPVEMRKPVKTNLATLRKFLSQHPQAEDALAQRFGKFVVRVLEDEEADRVDRARAGLYVVRWYPHRVADFKAVLKRLWDQGLAISDLSGEDEQNSLLEASHAAGVEADAILSALDSRFSAVREEAERFRAQLDDAGRAEMRHTLLHHAPRYPGAALRLIEEELAPRPDAERLDDRWQVLWAALALIEEKPKPSLAEKVVKWFETDGPFDELLDGWPISEEHQLRIRVLMRQWRSSDRYLFPALEAIERLGLVEEADAVRAARQKRAEKLFDRVGQQTEVADTPVMTRATWERLRKELERLERELRTTIPQTIRKARELGDLRENAEYHSAKLKQANVSKLVASLQLRLTRARFVDEMTTRDGVVGLGSEVVLESEDEVATWWILGEGEHHHGDHVISFQAPVGRLLMGRAIGDEVELGEGERRRRYRVVSIERRLPPHDVEEASAP